MRHLSFLNSIHQDNTVREWLLAFGAAVLIYCFASIAKRFVQKKLKSLAESTATNLDDLLYELLAATRGYFLLALSTYLSAQTLHLPTKALTFLEKGFILVALAQVATWGSRAIQFWIDNYLRKKALEDANAATSVGLISFTARLLLFVVVVLLAISNLGFDITALIAGLGVGGIAVALAVQNILGDLFASLTIVLDKPFVVGDFIVVGDFSGSIEHIGLKNTRIRSLSGEQLIFSNSDLLQSRIRNYKRMTERRVVFALNLVYQTPQEKLKRVPQLVRETIERKPQLRFDRCHFLKLGPSALEFETVYWVKSPEFNLHADLAQEINLEIFEKFASEGIRFAHPTQSLVLERSESWKTFETPEALDEPVQGLRSQLSSQQGPSTEALV